MRSFALLLQIMMAGPIGFYLAYAMMLGLPATSGRNEIPLIIILGGAGIGLLAWIPGLIADRVSLSRLVLTIALSMLGLLVSYLLVEATVSVPPWVPQSVIYGVPLAPLAGAMAGYYWREPRTQAE